VEGNRMAEELCRLLNVPYQKIGSLVLAFHEAEVETLRELCRRGAVNGVPGLKLLSRGELLELEPNLVDEVVGGLLAPSAAIVSPWEYALALAETAVRNGAEFFGGFAAQRIQKEEECFILSAADGRGVKARMAVNAAGVSSGEIHRLVGGGDFGIHPIKGQYYLLDKEQGNLVSHVIFHCPGKDGKGVLVSPTVHGNLLLGPDSVPALGPDDLSTDREGLAVIARTTSHGVKGIDLRLSIRNFAGLRAVAEQEDFIVGESPVCPGFFNAAGIKSPGLTAAPAIAAALVEEMGEAGLPLERRERFLLSPRPLPFHKMNQPDRERAIERDPAYSKVVCRCETVTEGDIMRALEGPIPPVSLDGIKRRCGSGMGRCQGGFCGPRIHEILSRQKGVPMERVAQDRDNMYIVVAPTKESCLG